MKTRDIRMSTFSKTLYPIETIFFRFSIQADILSANVVHSRPGIGIADRINGPTLCYLYFGSYPQNCGIRAGIGNGMGARYHVDRIPLTIHNISNIVQHLHSLKYRKRCDFLSSFYNMFFICLISEYIFEILVQFL